VVQKHVQDVEDLKFVVGDILRFASMEESELIDHWEHNKKDRLCNVPHPDGQGVLICSREALSRFVRIAERHLLAQKLEDHVDLRLFTNTIIEGFVDRFLGQQSNLDRKNVDKMLSAAVKKVRDKHKALTHFIPCVVVFESEPKEIQIGPVRFVWMESFLQEASDEIERERARIRREHVASDSKPKGHGGKHEQTETKEMSRTMADRLVDGLLDYFSEFKWISIVSVPECDQTVSRKRAEVAVEGALNVLKLFLGTSYGSTLRQGHSPGPPRQKANLTQETDGALHVSIGWSKRDAMVGTGWFGAITKPDPFFFQAAGSALFACVDPHQSTDLNQRFLDALSWYGQAISEAFPSGQIVKFVAALERLTITKKEKDITETVSKRTALLLSHGQDPKEFALRLSQAKKVYDSRSGLMHGSISPFDKRLAAVAPLAERLTRDALLLSLDLFMALKHELRNRTPTRSDLEKKYERLEAERADE
jgi:hypothetical protein